MDNNFHIFPSETFIDLCLYQYGHEKCTPGHLFGPATRNHYLFHYVLSGTGTLMATNSKGQNVNYQVRSGQGFMIFQDRSPLMWQIFRYHGNTSGWSLTGCVPQKSSTFVAFPRMRQSIWPTPGRHEKRWRMN